jgi:hypothetical protein
MSIYHTLKVFSIEVVVAMKHSDVNRDAFMEDLEKKSIFLKPSSAINSGDNDSSNASNEVGLDDILAEL